MLFRYLLLAFLGFLIMRILRRYFFGRSSQTPQRDPEKEVRNTSFKEEDIQDAKFKDIR